MAWFPIGPSSYPDLKGVIQVVNSKRIADQFLSMKRDFDAMKIAAGSGDRLSPNEGARSRARQDIVWDIYIRYGYPKAAVRYTSRHDAVNHGNAIDVGVTMANGQNRALTPAEFAWMHTQAEQRGFTWTGRSFNEPWHIEGATRPEVYPPYPDIIAGADPTPTPPAVSPQPPKELEEEDDVPFIINYRSTNSRNGIVLASLTGKWHKLTGEEAGNGQFKELTRDLKVIVPVNDREWDLLRDICTK